MGAARGMHADYERPGSQSAGRPERSDCGPVRQRQLTHHGGAPVGAADTDALAAASAEAQRIADYVVGPWQINAALIQRDPFATTALAAPPNVAVAVVYPLTTSGSGNRGPTSPSHMDSSPGSPPAGQAPVTRRPVPGLLAAPIAPPIGSHRSVTLPLIALSPYSTKNGQQIGTGQYRAKLQVSENPQQLCRAV
jgi:hypothetical protein